jgi:hypothetical protein
LNASQALTDGKFADFDLRIGRDRPDQPFVVSSVRRSFIRPLEPVVGDEEAAFFDFALVCGR